MLPCSLGSAIKKNLPKESKKMRKTFKYGVQWDPQDFLEVQHPKNPHNSLPDVLKEAMFQVLSSDPIELAKHRLQVVLAVKRRAGELVTEEKKLKSQMDSTLSGVLAPKSLALWKSLMEETDIKMFPSSTWFVTGYHCMGSMTCPLGRFLTGDLPLYQVTSFWRLQFGGEKPFKALALS